MFFSNNHIKEHYYSTDDYIKKFDAQDYMHRGSDFFDKRYSLDRLNKNWQDGYDSTFDYPYELIKEVETKLEKVDRKKALKGIFNKLTYKSLTDHDRHISILNFLYKASFHNAIQPMYEDKQAVFDPLVHLELGEMRCGAVARLAADIFGASGYKTRLVQAAYHTTAEIFYDNEWHLFEADLAGGNPITINQKIPSMKELSENPFLIDKIPTKYEEALAKGGEFSNDLIYPSYFYFNKKAHNISVKNNIGYYYKTASELESKNSKWYGWDFYKSTPRDYMLRDFQKKYEPSIPKLKSIKFKNDRFIVEWYPLNDKDNDLIGYRVYLSTKSRGWNYNSINTTEDLKKYFIEGWSPEMYDNLYKEPPSDVGLIETKNNFIEIPFKLNDRPIFFTIMGFDKHGESVGRRLYNQSAEFKLYLKNYITDK